MLFKGYENYIIERKINLTQYIGDNIDENNFHENFFKDIPANPWEGFTVKSLISFFDSNREEKNGLIDQLINNEVTHVLLIFSQKFINTIIAKKRKKFKERIRPKEFTKRFIEKFSQEFISNEIGSSILVSGSRQKQNTQDLEEWLNLRELQKSLQLNADESYLLGFKDMKISSSSSRNLISLVLNNRNLIIKENCSVLLGSSILFKFNTSSPKSIIKVTNNTNDNSIEFITENIYNIESNSYELQEEYLNDEVFDEFEFNANKLKKNNIKIKFDKTSIIFSNRIPTITIEEEREKRKEPIINREKNSSNSSRTIGINSDEDKPSTQDINFKDNYLVTLNRFIIPYEDDLKEVHYHLIKNKSKFILVGGSKSDPRENALAKVVANLVQNSIEVTNLSVQPMSFKIAEDKVRYQINRNSSKRGVDTIDTDEPKRKQEIKEVRLKKGESYSFKERIEFPNSAIEFNENGVAVEYINFIIGSFNNRLEFNRHYFRHFGSGNIIDNRENLDYAGRIYEGRANNILGSVLSRNPMILNLSEEKFTLSNQIKEQYNILVTTATKESEITFQEEEHFSKKDLLSKKNYISISKDGIVLVEITILAN